jgi:Na+-driven multidrug efflux pump
MATMGKVNVGNGERTKIIAIIAYVACISHIVVGVLTYLGLMRQPIIELFVSPPEIYHAICVAFYLFWAIWFTKRLKSK